MVLKAYERVQTQWPRPDPRHRIEHCSLVNPDLLGRIKAAGVIPTPFWTYAHYHGEKWKEYGDERMNWMFAHRSFLDYGIRVPGASDYGPGPFEPLMALQSMVTRKDFNGQRLGTEPAGHGRRGADDRHDQRRLRVARGARQGLDHRRASTPTSWCSRRTHTTSNPDEIKDIQVVRTGRCGRPQGDACSPEEVEGLDERSEVPAARISGRRAGAAGTAGAGAEDPSANRERRQARAASRPKGRGIRG